MPAHPGAGPDAARAGIRRWRGRRDLVEGAVVPRGLERGQDRRVVAMPGVAPRVDGPRDEVEGLGRHDHRRARGGVEAAQLTRRPEAAPHRLEPLDRGRRHGAEIVAPGVIVAQREHRHVGSHGAEVRGDQCVAGFAGFPGVGRVVDHQA